MKEEKEEGGRGGNCWRPEWSVSSPSHERMPSAGLRCDCKEEEEEEEGLLSDGDDDVVRPFFFPTQCLCLALILSLPPRASINFSFPSFFLLPRVLLPMPASLSPLLALRCASPSRLRKEDVLD